LASQINASNSGFGGIVSTGDSSGQLQLQTAGTTALTIDTSQNTTLAGKLTTASSGIQFLDGSTQTAAASPFGLKNRIINGDMVIDQRNAGASVALSGSSRYAVDRFIAFYTSPGGAATAQQSSTAPAGFNRSLVYTVTTGASITTGDYNCIQQNIEGLNVSDLGWGTANAQTVTLSFWVRSSLTGTFSGSLVNSAQNRSYVFTYTINAANTWEKETITISGDTTGTWLTTNGTGISIYWNMGFQSGSLTSTTNTWLAGAFTGVTGGVTPSTTTGATFFLTGVQLERNTTATPFEWLPYGMELALCQRYFQRLGSGTVADIAIGSGISRSSTIAAVYVKHNTPMRTAPTATQSSLVITDAETYNATVTSISINASSSESRVVATCSGGGMTQYRAALLSQITSGTGYLDLSAEL